jgi:hypothetical protein
LPTRHATKGDDVWNATQLSVFMLLSVPTPWRPSRMPLPACDVDMTRYVISMSTFSSDVVKELTTAPLGSVARDSSAHCVR